MDKGNLVQLRLTSTDSQRISLFVEVFDEFGGKKAKFVRKGVQELIKHYENLLKKKDREKYEEYKKIL